MSEICVNCGVNPVSDEDENGMELCDDCHDDLDLMYSEMED